MGGSQFSISRGRIGTPSLLAKCVSDTRFWGVNKSVADEGQLFGSYSRPHDQLLVSRVTGQVPYQDFTFPRAFAVMRRPPELGKAPGIRKRSQRRNGMGPNG